MVGESFMGWLGYLMREHGASRGDYAVEGWCDGQRRLVAIRGRALWHAGCLVRDGEKGFLSSA